MKECEFRWGILGPGSIANKFADALAVVPGAILHAVGSRDLARAEAFATRYGASRAYGSYEALAEDPDLDAVYIATPHPMHCENAIACLEREKAVLVEKPISVDASSVRQMVEAARRNRTFLMEAMWTRFLPANRFVKELVASGAIGEVRLLTADFSFSSAPDPASRLFAPELAGGALLDVGIYVLSFASMILGAHPVEASSFTHIGPTGVDEQTAAILRYPEGAIASLTCGVRATGSSQAHVMGTEGRIALDPFWSAQSVHIFRKEGEETLPFPFDRNGFEYQIREVMDCVRQGHMESELMRLDDSIAILETMDRMRSQWNQGSDSSIR